MNKDNSLCVKIADLTLNTPVLAASGTFGYGEEFADFVDFAKLGGVTVKGTTLKPRRGNKGVRVAETPAGMLNSIGLQNPGAEYFIENILPRIKKLPTNIIVNISASAADEYGELAKILDVDGVDALEVNVSCPNVKDGGIVFGTDPKALFSVTEAVKKNTKKPVIVKLSPNVTDIKITAKAAEDAGADALSLINTLIGMDIDIETRQPILGNVTGGLSGAAVLPVALYMVHEAYKTVKIPIIGMGGITKAEDAAKFFIAGARAVAVGTANFSDPGVTMKIVVGLQKYLRERNLASIGELTGTLAVPKEGM